MTELFIEIINMSVIGSLAIGLVLIIRLFLRKAPKVYSYLLWLAPLIRLLCPFTIKSAYSIIHVSPHIISDTLAAAYAEHIGDRGLIDLFVLWGSPIWFYVSLIILLLSIYSYLKLRFILIFNGGQTQNNIYITNRMSIPFVIGFAEPRIYLPVRLDKTSRKYIIMHESAHIKSFDYIVKFLFHLALTIHWFNPLVHIAYRLMETDMEMSCDEKVIANANRKEYASVLLKFVSLKPETSLPVFFGFCNVKSRIKNILNYKKPHPAIRFFLFSMVIIFLFVCTASP